jgi:hypothetical protein
VTNLPHLGHIKPPLRPPGDSHPAGAPYRPRRTPTGQLPEPGACECRPAAGSGPSSDARPLPGLRGYIPRRSRSAGRRTGTRRTTRADDTPQLRTSSASGSHPGLRPGLGHAPIGHGRLSTLLASVEFPTARCVNRQRCACESRHDFRRACRVTSSDRRPARQGKAPTGLPLQIEAVPALPQRSRPDPRRRPVRRGLRAGHRINAEATRGPAGAGERARHRRARVPTAAARVGAKGRTERRSARRSACERGLFG